MKKLLFVHNKLVCGGAESALYDLVRLLDKNKYDVTVLVLNDGGEWEQKFKDAGIKVINSYSKLIQGRRIHNFILRKRIEYSRNHHGKNLISLCTDDDFDLAIVNYVTSFFKETVSSANCKKIHYLHGDPLTNIYYKNILNAENNFLNMYDCFICVSKLAGESFKKLYGFDNKVFTCFNPIDDIAIKEKSTESIIEALPQKYICSIGRLAEEKGYDRLIKIHKQMIDSGIENNLVIVGDGPERERLEFLINELGISNSVYLIGYKSNPYPYIKNSLFTVVSSYSEGLSMTALESICLGVPVVSSFPTVGELFGNECCGIITEIDDDSLKAGLEKMLLNKDFYQQALLGAKKRSDEFTSKKMIIKVEKVFDKVMGE